MKLDHRNLRTPLKQLFLVPTEGLALAVAEEWEGQRSLVQPSLMHITSLCNTVLDKSREDRDDDTVRYLLGYLSSDTLWCVFMKNPLYNTALFKSSFVEKCPDQYEGYPQYNDHFGARRCSLYGNVRYTEFQWEYQVQDLTVKLPTKQY